MGNYCTKFHVNMQHELLLVTVPPSGQWTMGKVGSAERGVAYISYRFGECMNARLLKVRCTMWKLNVKTQLP